MNAAELADLVNARPLSPCRQGRRWRAVCSLCDQLTLTIGEGGEDEPVLVYCFACGCDNPRAIYIAATETEYGPITTSSGRPIPFLDNVIPFPRRLRCPF